MQRLFRLALASVAALGLAVAAAPATAQEAKPLVIGGTRTFMVRVGDTVNGREMSVDDRINHVQDVYAKYLGGQHATFSWKKWRDRVHIYLNDTFLIAVSPEDARASGYKTSAQLAPIWVKGLTSAFNNTHVHLSGKSRR